MPEAYTERSGQPVDAEVVQVPFRPSVNPSARERAQASGATTPTKRRRPAVPAIKFDVSSQRRSGVIGPALFCVKPP